MQIAGRSCDACGALVHAVGGADGCGSCDVVVCAACLRGTDRCPSCQRSFRQTRDLDAHAKDAGGPAARGRRQMIAVAVSLAGAVIVVALLGGTPPAHAALQLGVIALLLLQLARGRGWARWLLVAFTAIAAVANGMEGLRHAGDEARPWMIGVALAAVFAWCSFVLALSAPLAAFLRVQRRRHP